MWSARQAAKKRKQAGNSQGRSEDLNGNMMKKISFLGVLEYENRENKPDEKARQIHERRARFPTRSPVTHTKEDAKQDSHRRANCLAP
jgi:hypothetical protein